MKNIFILCFFALILNGYTIAIDPPAADEASIVNRIVARLRIPNIKDSFCAQGTLFRTTVRSGSGKYCTKDNVELRSLAVLACYDVSDFAKSKCAGELPKTANEKPNLNPANYQVTLAGFYKGKNESVILRTCVLIGEIIPEEEVICESIVKDEFKKASDRALANAMTSDQEKRRLEAERKQEAERQAKLKIEHEKLKIEQAKKAEEERLAKKAREEAEDKDALRKVQTRLTTIRLKAEQDKSDQYVKINEAETQARAQAERAQTPAELSKAATVTREIGYSGRMVRYYVFDNVASKAIKALLNDLDVQNKSANSLLFNNKDKKVHAESIINTFKTDLEASLKKDSEQYSKNKEAAILKIITDKALKFLPDGITLEYIDKSPNDTDLGYGEMINKVQYGQSAKPAQNSDLINPKIKSRQEAKDILEALGRFYDPPEPDPY